jgi:selenocysteine lyase/cysteine desulfurase
MVDQVHVDTQKLTALRAGLPAVSAGIYLDVATAGPLPAETAAALGEADEWETRVGRGGIDREAELEQREAEAMAVIAALIPGSDPDEIVLTHGALDAMYRVARDVGAPGDEAIVGEGCVEGTAEALAAARLNARVIGADAVPEAISRSTALIVVPHVDRVTGQVTDLDRLLDANEGHAQLVVDASGSAGAMDLARLEGWGTVILPGDRWLLGPDGTGAVRSVRSAGSQDGRPDLESGGERPPRRSLLGLARSVGWLEMYVGLPWIYERTAPLAASLAQGLAESDRVELLTPVDRMAAIVTFRVKRWSAEQVAEELSHRVGAIVSIVAIPAAEPAIRASVGWWNTEEEVGRFTEAVRLLGAHTPDNIPRRPALTMLPG